MRQGGSGRQGSNDPATFATGSGNSNRNVPETMLPPPWVGASGRVYHGPPSRRTPPFLELPPLLHHPAYPPHPSIVDQPIRLLGNLPMPQSPSRDLNAPRGPPPQSLPMRILTGSIQQIVEWTENVQGVPIYEVTGFLYGIGMVNPVYPPAPGNEINLLLRDRRDSGPTLQVIQPYHLYPEIPRGIQTGQLLRCIGKVLDARKMLAIKISVVPPSEANDYCRLGHVCRFTS